jgi:hypothetical protein
VLFLLREETQRNSPNAPKEILPKKLAKFASIIHFPPIIKALSTRPYYTPLLYNIVVGFDKCF